MKGGEREALGYKAERGRKMEGKKGGREDGEGEREEKCDGEQRRTLALPDTV